MRGVLHQDRTRAHGKKVPQVLRAETKRLLQAALIKWHVRTAVMANGYVDKSNDLCFVGKTPEMLISNTCRHRDVFSDPI